MFVSYLFAKEAALPPMAPGLYEYVVGANGTFVRSQRPEFDALIAASPAIQPVRGLAVVNPAVNMRAGLVPAGSVAAMCRHAYKANPKEILFYLSYAGRWIPRIPAQVQKPGSVIPVNPFAGGSDTAIEIHSHHHMRAYFSATDNREESTGFRIYAVLGLIDTDHPEIRVRVGIYGHFYEIPAAWVFELPTWLRDARENDKAEELQYDEVEYAA